MAFSSYPNGISNLVLRGTPLISTNPGRVFFCNNSGLTQPGQIGGSDGNPGTYQKPFSSLNYAITQCVANRGDIIILAPGHTETITSATSLVLGTAGVAIIGLGTGSNRPTFTFTTANTATVAVTAANITLQNILFISSFLNVAGAITATGTATPKDLTIDNCEFRDTAGATNFIASVVGNATANCLDGLSYSNNKVYGFGVSGGTCAIAVNSTSDRISILDNYVIYPALNDTAGLVKFGANAQRLLRIGRNQLFRPSTSTTGGSLFSGGGTTSTGYVYDNYSYHLNATTGILAPTGTGLAFQNNYCMFLGAVDKSGSLNPVAV